MQVVFNIDRGIFVFIVFFVVDDFNVFCWWTFNFGTRVYPYKFSSHAIQLKRIILKYEL